MKFSPGGDRVDRQSLVERNYAAPGNSYINEKHCFPSRRNAAANVYTDKHAGLRAVLVKLTRSWRNREVRKG